MNKEDAEYFLNQAEELIALLKAEKDNPEGDIYQSTTLSSRIYSPPHPKGNRKTRRAKKGSK